MNIENGLEKNLEGERKPEEKIEREKVLQVLQKLRKVFLPGFSPLPPLGEIAKGGRNIMKLVRPFLGHPERTAWLESFLEELEMNMRNALPEGIGMDVLTDIEKWSAFYREHEVDGVGEHIFDVVRVKREEFREKMYNFETEDTQGYQI